MIEVLRSGIYTTIQDLGRYGYRKYGVPLSGAMDQSAATRANHMLGNEVNSAVLEMLVNGPQVVFATSCWICISGSMMEVLVDGNRIPMDVPILINQGSVVTFGRIEIGRYAYVAFKGGITSDVVMNSRSQFAGITSDKTVRKGDALRLGDSNIQQAEEVEVLSTLDYKSPKIYVEKGPEFDLLTRELQELIFQTDCTVSNASNRIGYLLESKFEKGPDEIITAPVQPGTVQMTPSGNVIVLMRDAQTTGGYARILQLLPESIDVLAQKRVGEIVQFVMAE